MPIPTSDPGSPDTLDYAKSINGYLLDYIKYGDAKAGAVLALIGVASGGLSFVAKDLLDLATKGPLLVSLLVVVGLGLIAGAFLSAWFCLTALSPLTTEGHSLNSFPDIAKSALLDYISQVGRVDRSAIVENYAKHNWKLASIAKHKFDAIENAVHWLRLYILSALGAFFLFLVVKFPA